MLRSHAIAPRRLVVAALLALLLPAPVLAGAADKLVLAAADGTRLTLADAMGGRPAVVHFWATWCAPWGAEPPLGERTGADAAAPIGGRLQDDGCRPTRRPSRLGAARSSSPAAAARGDRRAR